MGMIHSDYLTRAFCSIEDIIEHAKEALKDVQFDAFAVRGTSGLLIGPILARELKKGLIVCRKPNDSSHTSYRAEGAYAGTYVFLDDFIASGATRDAVAQTLKDTSVWYETKRVGCYLYRLDYTNNNWIPEPETSTV